MSSCSTQYTTTFGTRTVTMLWYKCYCLPAQCRQGEIRLVNGTNNREGRVEVCIDGRWGTVCRRGWEQEDTNFVCTELGFPSEGSEMHACSMLY